MSGLFLPVTPVTASTITRTAEVRANRAYISPFDAKSASICLVMVLMLLTLTAFSMHLRSRHKADTESVNGSSFLSIDATAAAAAP